MRTFCQRTSCSAVATVDYALGAEPHTGAFVIAYEDHPKKREELAYYKMGDGPFYVFYTPYHLPRISNRLDHRSRCTLKRCNRGKKAGALFVEGTAAAKRDLKAGEILDGVGGFMVYGIIRKYPRHLCCGKPASNGSDREGCRLLDHVAKDRPLTYADVELPQGRLCDTLYALQKTDAADRSSCSNGMCPRIDESQFLPDSKAAIIGRILILTCKCWAPMKLALNASRILFPSNGANKSLNTCDSSTSETLRTYPMSSGLIPTTLKSVAGALLSLIDENPAVEVRWVVFSAEPPRNIEAKRSTLSSSQRDRRRRLSS